MSCASLFSFSFFLPSLLVRRLKHWGLSWIERCTNKTSAYEGNWIRFGTTPTTWSLHVYVFGRNVGASGWWRNEQTTPCGTTNHHAGHFPLNSHPPFVEGRRIGLVKVGDECRYSWKYVYISRYLFTLSREYERICR